MKLTTEEYNELLKRHPNLDPERVRASKQKPPAGPALVKAAPRKEPSDARFAIRFEISAVRPCDWDNPWTKCLQDCLRYAGILHEDSWDMLEGSVACKKASKKNEETKIILTKI
jgi:hypothetical protein